MSSLHRPNPAALERVRVVLVQPSHPGNVGACARAMRVMGLRDLAIVAPRFDGVAAHPEALAFASGATDVLAASREYPTLDAAVAGATLVLGISAETREFGPPPLDPEAAARLAFDDLAAQTGHRVALVFGPERTGLSISDVGRCQALCSIPGDAEYCSLNLSQAVQLIAYVLRREALARADAVAAAATPADDLPRHAAQEDIAAFFEHFERAMVAIRFLDPAHPKKLMARMRRLFSRARLETEEVQLLRGVCRQAELAGESWRAAGYPAKPASPEDPPR